MNIRLTRQVFALCHLWFSLRRFLVPLTGLDLGPAGRDLDRAVADIERRIGQRRAAGKAMRKATKAIAVRRRDLWVRAIRPVATVVRLKLSHERELATLELPRQDASIGALILHAHLLADVVTRHHAAFRAHGIDQSAPRNLRTLAEGLRALADERDSLQRIRADHSAAIKASVRLGRQAVQMIDGLWASEFADRPFLRKLWDDAKRGAAGARTALPPHLQRAA